MDAVTPSTTRKTGNKGTFGELYPDEFFLLVDSSLDLEFRVGPPHLCMRFVNCGQLTGQGDVILYFFFNEWNLSFFLGDYLRS